MSVVGYVFLVIELVLKLLGLWEKFEEWLDARRLGEQEERRVALDKAIEDLKKAMEGGTDEEIEDAQRRLVEASR